MSFKKVNHEFETVNKASVQIHIMCGCVQPVMYILYLYDNDVHW